MAGDGRVLLYQYTLAVGARGHDAGTVGGFRDHGHGRRLDGGPLLLRLLAVQSRRRRRARSVRRRASCRSARRPSALARCCSRQAIGRRPASAACCRAPAACSRWSAPSTSRRPASRLARGDADRRDADVRHGRRIRRSVRRRPVIGAGLPWQQFWIAMGIGGLAISVCCSCCCPQPAAASRHGDWLAGRCARWAWSSAIRSRFCAA